MEAMEAVAVSPKDKANSIVYECCVVKGVELGLIIRYELLTRSKTQKDTDTQPGQLLDFRNDG